MPVDSHRTDSALAEVYVRQSTYCYMSVDREIRLSTAMRLGLRDHVVYCGGDHRETIFGMHNSRLASSFDVRQFKDQKATLHRPEERIAGHTSACFRYSKWVVAFGADDGFGGVRMLIPAVLNADFTFNGADKLSLINQILHSMSAPAFAFWKEENPS